MSAGSMTRDTIFFLFWSGFFLLFSTARDASALVHRDLGHQKSSLVVLEVFPLCPTTVSYTTATGMHMEEEEEEVGRRGGESKEHHRLRLTSYFYYFLNIYYHSRKKKPIRWPTSPARVVPNSRANSQNDHRRYLHQVASGAALVYA